MENNLPQTKAEARLRQDNRRLRAGIKAIQDGTVSGAVQGEDVVWFDGITTLHDFCGQLLST